MATTLLESPTWCRIGECDCPEYEAEEDASPLTPCELCDHPAAHHSPPVKLTLQQATEIKARGDKALEYCKAKKEGLPCGCPCFIPDTLQATEGRSTQGVCALCRCRQGWHNFNPKLVAAEEPPFGHLMTPPMSPPPTLFASPTHSQASSGWPASHLAHSIGGSSTGARSDVSSIGPSTRQSWGSLGPGGYPSPPSAQRLSNPQAAALHSHQSFAQHASPFLGGAHPHALLVESPSSSNQPTSASAEAPSPLELSPRGETILGARSMSPVEQALQEEDEQDPARRQFVDKGKGRRTSTTSSSAAIERQDEKLNYYNRARHDSIDRLLVRSASSHSSTSLGAPRVASPAPSPPPQRALPPPPATLPTAIDRPLPPPQISAARSALLQPSHTPAPAPQPSPFLPPADVAYHSDAPSDAESLMDPEDSVPVSRRGTLRTDLHESVGSFATGLAESGSTYPEGDDSEEEEAIASPPQPSRTRDEIELAGWREAARQAVQAGAGRPVRSPTGGSAVGGEERARERLAFPMPPEQSSSALPSSATPPSFLHQPFSHNASRPLGDTTSSAPAPTLLRPTFEDPMASPAAHQQWQLPASSSMSRLGSSSSFGEQEMLRAAAGQRQGSLASVNSNATMHIGQRDRTGSFGVQSPPPVPMANSSPTVPDDPIWRDYRSKNLTLSISPPVDSGRWLPGQVFSFRLVLDPKVSRTSYDKLEVKLVGNSFVYGEPPDNHDFMVQRTSIFPSSSPSVREIGTAATSFSWQMQLPREHTCDCSLQPHVLPPSYGHANFRVEYMVELLGKKEARFGRGTAEKLKIHFGVNVPAESGLNLSRTLTSASGASSVDGLVHGVEGMWRTVTQTPKVAPKMGANGPLVTAVQLAYHTVRSPDPSSLRLVYRLSLIFGTHPPNSAHGIDQALLDRIWASPHIAVVARKITIAKSGRKASKPFVLPVVRPTQKDAKGKSGIEVVDGAMMYVMEGFTELNKMEAKNVTTCSVVVRFNLRVSIPVASGITAPIDLIAHDIALDLPPALPTSPSVGTSFSPLLAPHSPNTNGDFSPNATGAGRRISLAAYSDSSSSTAGGYSHNHPYALQRSLSEESRSTSKGAHALAQRRPSAPAPSSTTSSHSHEPGAGAGSAALFEQEDEEGEGDDLEPPPPFEDAVRNDEVDWVAAEARFGLEVR